MMYEDKAKLAGGRKNFLMLQVWTQSMSLRNRALWIRSSAQLLVNLTVMQALSMIFPQKSHEIYRTVFDLAL
jgi:hypothetical protein